MISRYLTLRRCLTLLLLITLISILVFNPYRNIDHRVIQFTPRFYQNFLHEAEDPVSGKFSEKLELTTASLHSNTLDQMTEQTDSDLVTKVDTPSEEANGPPIEEANDSVEDGEQLRQEEQSNKENLAEQQKANDASWNQVGAQPNFKLPQIDPNKPSKRKWPGDPECNQYTTHFGMNISRRYLVSFPRSGNTWTRYLLEGASGFFTGSIYNSRMLKNFGFLGERSHPKGKKVLIYKSHSSLRKDVPDGAPAILLLRDPFRSLVSLWSYFQKRPSAKRIKYNASEESYRSKWYSNFVRKQTAEWTQTATLRLKWSRKLLVVHYDNLKADPIGQVRRMLNFLEFPADEGRLKCIEKHLEGPALGLQRTNEPFSEEQKRLLKSAIQKVNRLLLERGLQKMPSHPEL